jgi:penicillin-binding protein 1C
LATRVWSAAKTGTSKDMRDNWCIGFTSRYTVGVWVGNFSGAPMHDVSGVTGAAPIWRDLIHRLHEAEPSIKPVAPPGLIVREVAFEPAVEAERDEWFLAGTQSSVVVASAGANASSAVTPHIRYPAPETVIALDPDIAEEHQRVMFQASPVLPGMQWRIGDTVLADVHGRSAWSPLPGKYVLFLENGAGQALSSVPFEVRGNMAR